jgi:holo-[acyl-carrier protein] synthase
LITGLGVDIVEIERMKGALERHPRLGERLFSAEEQRYCMRRSRPEVHFALRFAAKRAVRKAMGDSLSGTSFTDVEVAIVNGRPVPQLSGRTAERARELGIVEMHLSLSFTHVSAVASAVAITEEARPRKEARPDPMAELAASFKEARALLDAVGGDAAPDMPVSAPSADARPMESGSMG